MKIFSLPLSLIIICTSAFSQTLYVPNSTSGIANTSNPSNGKVGVGTNNPAEQLELIDPNATTRKVGINGLIQNVTTGGLMSMSRTSDGAKSFHVGTVDNATYADAVLANITPNSEMRFVSGSSTSQGFGFYTNKIGSDAFATTRQNALIKIDGSGNMGIGLVNPITKLDIFGGGGTYVDMRVNGRIQSGDNNLNGGMWVNSLKTMLVGQASSNTMGLNNNGWRVVARDNGMVGINNTNPVYALDVAGTGSSTVDIRVNGRMSTGDAGNNGGIYVNQTNTMLFGQQSASAFGMYNGTAWTLVSANNRIGINNTNPQARLDVVGTGGSTADIKVNGRIQSGDAGNIGGLMVGTGTSMMFAQQSGTALGIYNNGWRVTASTTGFVGINTTTPAAALDIVGGGAAGTDLKVNGRITSGDANNQGGVWVNSGQSMFVGQTSATSMGLFNAGAWRLVVDNSGNVGIGTTAPDAPLAVKGRIHAKEVKVDVTGALAPDYVFAKDYSLPSLEKVKAFIDKNHHLPEVPSAKEMEANGVELGEMNLLLLKKIEELTLYVIEQQKQIDYLKSKIEK